MTLKRGLVTIFLILILMAKLKIIRGRIYEGKHKNHREVNKLNFHGLQTRHYNHYLHKKHHKCNPERSFYRQVQAKKPSRYPTLDKIVDRLDSRPDHSKMTTVNPFEEWNATTASFNRSISYTYYTVGFLTNGTTGRSASRGDEEPDVWIKEGSLIARSNRHKPDVKASDNDNDNNVIYNNNVYGKGFMQDHTTSSPWENEQHDVGSRTGVSSHKVVDGVPGLSTSLPQPSWTNSTRKNSTLSKLPSWPIGRLVPKAKEERKKSTTPMPYVAAHEHYEQVLRMGDCHIPKEKVIKVHEVHPDPSKSYSPSCTILHQCSDDTGCCRDLKQVCKPKNTTKVELYFFTTTLGKPQTVEKLHFVNHTECECQIRTEEAMPRDSEFRRHHFKNVASSKVIEEKKKRNNCTCPSKYSARFLANESCICDCFDKQEDCLVLKKGKSHFSYHDKLCIQQGICRLPSCEFGSYIIHFGRCPNRSEKYYYSWNRVLSYRDLIT